MEERSDKLSFFYKDMLGKALFPIHADINISESEFARNFLPGLGFTLSNGTFDARLVFNKLVQKRAIFNG